MERDGSGGGGIGRDLERSVWIWKDPLRISQDISGRFRTLQTNPDPSRSFQIHPDTSRSIQTCPNHFRSVANCCLLSGLSKGRRDCAKRNVSRGAHERARALQIAPSNLLR